jgi:3-methyladenine DNA glycosylase AlkD
MSNHVVSLPYSTFSWLSIVATNNMSVSDVMALVEQNKNERGIANWQTMESTGHLKSFGVGLTQLRKLAKKIGRNHELALECWQSDYYDLRVIGLLIDEPKKITREQAESQVENLEIGMLTHVFSTCDATLAKSPIAFDMAIAWRDSEYEPRKKSAFGLFYELSKNKRDKRLTDAFFLEQVAHIDQHVDNASKNLRLAMGAALMGIGKRNLLLNKAAIVVAKRVGPIDFNEGTAKCDPFNVLKHLDNEPLHKKLTSM